MTCQFGVLADPTLGPILERLAKGPHAVIARSCGLPISRHAVSDHLAALKTAGLVSDEAQGTYLPPV